METMLSGGVSTARDCGQCDIEGCGNEAVMVALDGDGNTTQRRCAGHRSEDVKRANHKMYTDQAAERATLAHYGTGTPIVIFVSDNKNLDGYYTASVANPINSCSVGFGGSPVRALRDLALKLADDADMVLHAIKEHAFETREIAQELGISLGRDDNV